MKKFITLIVFNLLMAVYTMAQVISALTPPANPQKRDLTGPAGSQFFGRSITLLTNGNYVISDNGYSEGGLSGIGAVYLYNGSNHSLISTLKGSKASDFVGSAVTALSNGNYVVSSTSWDNATIANAGAVTWCSGTLGINGVVSAANSLVGSLANDNVGTISALSNGNYVVLSSNWDNVTLADVGAVTWCNGTTGRTGTINSSNSLLGTKANDKIGDNGIFTLSNSNYIVQSKLWENGPIVNAGAATWCNGTTGRTGNIAAANSLVGNTQDDFFSIAIKELTNGNYVIGLSRFDNGTKFDAGAAVWCGGTTVTSGTISIANALVGGASYDYISENGLFALTNGNYVVASSGSDNGAIQNAGAVTWGNGTAGTVGVVSSSNSLVGATANDNAGLSYPAFNNLLYVRTGVIAGITPLTNGNYVVLSRYWHGSGGLTEVGAVTWCSGTAATTGTITPANSLTGTVANDKVGLSGVTALTNGNYVVCSERWNNGSILGAGAATWGNGTTGIAGPVTAGNSLVGDFSNIFVGSAAVALTNGNYVVHNATWSTSNTTVLGAATWGNGSTGIAGPINAGNSLIGDAAIPVSALSSITPLTNGNYVVVAKTWGGGKGAVTWCNGNTGLTGTANTNNSFIGANNFNRIGSGGILPLSNGNYIIASPTSYTFNDEATVRGIGAVTWANGNGPIIGKPSVYNSLTGTTIDDQIGSSVFTGANNITTLPNGNYVVNSQDWDNGTITNAGAVTWGNGSSGTSGLIKTCNSVLGTTANGGSQGEATAMLTIYNPIHQYLIVGRPYDKIITIFNPNHIIADLAAHADTVASYVAAGAANMPLLANAGCGKIGMLTSNGANPINGPVKAKLWVETTQPAHNGRPYLKRHYQVTPDNNAATATGSLTIYAT